MEYPKFKVCCRCFTFNQAKYITDALNGFTMQQTSFPFVCTIVDDASTDGEQDVIRKYMEDNFDFSEGSVSYHKETDYAHITYAQHKTNKNCYFAVLYLKENHYSQRKPKIGYLSEWREMCEYEALCEGDDYWIVPDKLQKQVDAFCDDNVTMIYTDYKNVDENGIEIIRNEYENMYKSFHHSGDNLPDLFRTNYPLTVTVMCRTSIYNIEPLKSSPARLDYMLFMSCAIHGNFVYINEKTSCYRCNRQSFMFTQTDMIKNTYLKIYPYVSQYYLKGKNRKKESFCNDFLIRMQIAYRALKYQKEESLDYINELVKTNFGIIFYIIPCYLIFYFKTIKNKLRCYHTL